MGLDADLQVFNGRQASRIETYALPVVVACMIVYIF